MIKKIKERTEALTREKDPMEKGPDFFFNEPNRITRNYWWFGVFNHQILNFQTHIFMFTLPMEPLEYVLKIMNQKVSKCQPL